MSKPSSDSLSQYFAKKKTRKKKRHGFNASAETLEQEVNDIVGRVVKQLSAAELKRALADCAGCDHRKTALTILRDMVFAFGTDDEKTWPRSSSSLYAIVEFSIIIRSEFDRELNSGHMVNIWRELGALGPKADQTRKEEYQWDLDRVQNITSFLTFDNPGLATISHETNTTSESASQPFPEFFIRKIPDIVRVVAFAGKEKGATATLIVRETQMRLRPSENPDPMLRAVPELRFCRGETGRYFLSNEDGYDEPFLAGYMSRGGGGQKAMQVLQTLSILCEERFPHNTHVLKFALAFCDLKKMDNVMECWRKLGVFGYMGSAKKRNSRGPLLEWDIDRIRSLFASSLVASHLERDGAINTISQNLPILDDTSLAST